MPVDTGEFGWRGRPPLVLGVLGAASLYAAGWALEDTRYWLRDEAVVVWAGALPVWLLVIAALRRANGLGWAPGFLIALCLFVLHAAAMWLIDGRLADDHVGIAAMFAGAALGGWLVGRALHLLIRRARASPRARGRCSTASAGDPRASPRP